MTDKLPYKTALNGVQPPEGKYTRLDGTLSSRETYNIPIHRKMYPQMRELVKAFVVLMKGHDEEGDGETLIDLFVGRVSRTWEHDGEEPESEEEQAEHDEEADDSGEDEIVQEIPRRK
jgi:hypothetical protein